MGCPKCKYEVGVFVPCVSIVVDNGNVLMPAKLLGFCNNPVCDQRWWWFFKSRRLTRRNTGPSSWREVNAQV